MTLKVGEKRKSGFKYGAEKHDWYKFSEDLKLPIGVNACLSICALGLAVIQFSVFSAFWFIANWHCVNKKKKLDCRKQASGKAALNLSTKVCKHACNYAPFHLTRFALR